MADFFSASRANLTEVPCGSACHTHSRRARIGVWQAKRKEKRHSKKAGGSRAYDIVTRTYVDRENAEAWTVERARAHFGER